ncbi:transketolase C-terminal domain-containing protein [Halobacteriovorax sp. GB3]|uniref:transketolase C-terminal domain-containing protein n=1 Tax=Halobacteriovorax sp. GB3 TaxID=2719615 RepID=UPI00236133C6|nr:transketolase C-terminal domain-containing protein [Halobacteriovorax sp. GB3]MDD0852080.1 transketolase C-terminal domain-containing protein [Halobacteriovorax sp. GB3]
MSLSQLTPLKVANKLALNPTSELKYASEVTDKEGNKIKVGCPMATRALVALMNQHAVIGGAACHWGGPAAFAETMSALHGIMFNSNKQWFEAFNFVNDAGHAENGIYALRANYGFDNLDFKALRGFRSIESKLTGHGEAHLNPEGVFISNGPLGSGVPQAQGLCLADKIIGNDRTTLCVLSDGGSMEGETKEAFAAIPGLAKKNKMNPFVLIISDNNTKLSGRIEEDSFDMEPTFASLSALGWEVETVENGHDLQGLYTTFENSIEKAKKDPTKPIALILKTIKGYGVEATEKSASGGHGYPLKAYDDSLVSFLDEIYKGSAPEEFKTWANEILASKPAPKESAPSSVVKEKVQPGFARATIAAAKNGLPVFSVTSDLQGSTGIAAFHKEFPTHYVDIGIAESNMVSTAVGLSKQGLIPIVDTFAQFGVTKGNLPLIMAQLSEAPVIGLFSHTGFQDAADGASHQATTYFAATSSIPHTTVVSCSCSKEAELYMEQAINQIKEKRESGKVADSVLFFFGRESHPSEYVEGLSYEWGKAQMLKEGSDVTIVANGPMVQKALDAAKELAQKGINAAVINNAFVNKPDVDLIKKSLAATNGKLITIEDHQLVGGMGAQIVHALKINDVDFKVRTLANNGKFGQSAYKADHLYDLHKLNTEGILEAYNQMK